MPSSISTYKTVWDVRSSTTSATDGDLAASWQFQAGHLYDNINPGSVLGIAIPFDVSPDLGDMWLRVEQNPAIAIYLGNVSQLSQEN